MISPNQIIILETLGKNNCPATKTLICKTDGARGAIGYGRAVKFYGSVYYPAGIEELSALLMRFSGMPYALAVRGRFRDHVNLSKPVWRRKDPAKYPKALHTVCLEETALQWVMFDVDKLPLSDLGFSAPLHELDPVAMCEAILANLARYLPGISHASYHFQLSGTAGWFDPHTVSVHLWFWLDRPMTNPECKAFAKSVNAREGQNIIDPALYQAAQPHYIANPILGPGVDRDPIPVRSGLVQKAYDTLSLPAIEELPPMAQTRATPKKPQLSLPGGKNTATETKEAGQRLPYIRPVNFEGWLELIRQTDGGVHEILLDVTQWRANTGGLWCDWRDFRAQVEQAFRESVRGKKDPKRIEAVFSEGEYQRAVDGTIVRARAQFWRYYSSHFMLSHQDVDRLNERYLRSLCLPRSLKTLVIDSDLGTGKTEWFYRHVIKDAPLGNEVICLISRRSLAKAMAERFGITDYEDAKKAGEKGRHDMDTRMISVCTNSSLLLINPQGPLDVVFLDESDLLIQHLLGGAVPDTIRYELISHNLEMIRNAKHVVCAQSLVSDLTLLFLKMAGRDNPVKVVNTYQPWKGLPVDYFIKKDKALERLVEVAEKGIPFLCPCNSSGQALRNYLYMKERFPDRNYLLITQDVASEPEQSAFLANPNAHAHKYDGIFFSPSMESGVSLDSDYFQETIGFCNAGEGVGTPEAFVQMIMRGRKVKRVSLWVDPRHQDLPTTDEGCAAEAIARFQVAGQVIEHDGGEYIAFKKTPVVDLAMKAKAIQNKSKNRTDQVVYALLTERMGCDVRLVDSEPSELGIEVKKESKKLQKAQYQEQIQGAVKLAPAEYETLAEKPALTTQETWDVRRYRLETELCVDLNTETDIEVFEFWNQGRVLNAVRGFEEGMLTLDQAKAVASHLRENKAQHAEAQGVMTRWLIRRGIMESLKVSVDSGGNVVCDPDFKFKYEDLTQTWWYRFARSNRDAVNGSHLGCRISGKRPSYKEIGMWIRAMGIILTRHNLRSATDPKNISLKKEKRGSVAKGHQQSVFSVNLEAMQDFTEIIKRRRKAGVSAWGTLAAHAPSGAGVENLGAWLEDLGVLSPGVGDVVTLLHEYWFERCADDERLSTES